MPRNQSSDKVSKTKNIYNDINNGVVKKNITKNLKKPKKSVFKSFLKSVLKIFVIFMILGISLLAGATVAVWSFSSRLPDISKIQEYTPSETSEIYDINNRLLAKLHDEENRTIVPLKDIPLHVQQAVIAMEDERFYSHIGVDPKGIARAGASFFNKTLVKGGASTITQQLARNLFLTPEVKITRKIAEWMLAIKIERKFSKSKILELYLNQVYWGHNAYGVEAASKTFFGKSVKDLGLAEASLMGGLLSSPEYYSPLRNFKEAKRRQVLTLSNMVRNGYISQSIAEKTKQEPIKLFNLKRSYKFVNPYFTSYVISVLTDKYGDNLLRKGGLKVYTTMDPKAQVLAENLITTEIPKLKKTNNISQGALVSLDPNTGFIKTIVGGISYEQSQFNRATQAKRQPGSSFKPFVYAAAFKEGVITPNSIEVDGPISYPDMSGVWSPKNYDGHYRGALTIKDAFRKSINTIAVKTLDKIGVDKVIEAAKILGIESYIPPNLSIALGSAEVTPLEMAGAYGTFATGGKRARQITPILKILDRNGNVIEDYSYQEVDQVFDHKAIDLVNECAKAVVESGTGTAAQIPGRIIAGKTGTTSDHRDSWFIGYIPQLVTLVWIGNDNNSKMWRVTGGGFCAPIWKKYMEVVTKGMPVKDFPKVNDDKKGKNIAKGGKEGNKITGIASKSKKASTEDTEHITNNSDSSSEISNKPETETENDENLNSDDMSNLDAVEITSENKPKTKATKNSAVKKATKTTEKAALEEKPNSQPTPIQIIIPKKEPKKNTKKLDEELNSAMEDLKSVKEIYDNR